MNGLYVPAAMRVQLTTSNAASAANAPISTDTTVAEDRTGAESHRVSVGSTGVAATNAADNAEISMGSHHRRTFQRPESPLPPQPAIAERKDNAFGSDSERKKTQPTITVSIT